MPACFVFALALEEGIWGPSVEQLGSVILGGGSGGAEEGRGGAEGGSAAGGVVAEEGGREVGEGA